MYKLHLILKYLRKRRIAWVSLAAVVLCTAMVLVVLSVMGGWLRMFRQSFHGLSGDIIVHGESLTGFPYYQEMVDRLGQADGVEAAVPIVRTFGLVNIDNQIRQGVQVFGYPIQEIGKVNDFPQSLWRQHQGWREKYRTEAEAPGLEKTARQALLKLADNPPVPSFDLLPDIDYERSLPNAKSDVRKLPGMIVGAGLIGLNKESSFDERYLEYRAWALLTVLGVSSSSERVEMDDKAEQRFWLVDDSRTKIWQYDSNSVYVAFDVLQKMLRMNEYRFESGQVEPARASDIYVKVKAGFDLAAVKAGVEKIINEVRQEKMGNVGMTVFDGYPIKIMTWEESQKQFLDAIEKEVVLTTFLFGVISIVAIFLIFCIFYMIVVEKTKDIGIIKSVGATSAGVAGIFLGYGAAIGIVGAGLGLLVAWLIVRYINELHDALAKLMGVPIWDPAVYAFDKIPNTMDPASVAWILLIAVVASILGALVPAIRAARMNPVESLRWE